MKSITETDQQYVAHTYARFPVEIVSGKGALLCDSCGREYIDMGSGIAVNIFGASDDEWIRAVSDQLHKIQHTSNLYYTEPCARLAEALCLRTGMKKVFFSNSGAEANECAVKAAREYASIKKGKGDYNVVTLKNSFHGRTISMLSATGQDVFHEHFTPLTPGFLYATANDIEEMKKLVSENKVAAIMFEVVQGEGGVIPLDAEYLAGLKKIAEENDILLIADEVQCGNGRTGKLYSYMHYDMTPDMVTTAKGLGGGLPIGATLFGEKTENVYTPGLHGSTFGGNPVCAAGALNILSRIDDMLLEGVKERSEYIIKELSGAKGIRNVTGLGLMLGVETEKSAKDVVNAARERGVLLLTAKTKVRLLPPLNIGKEELIRAVNIIKEVCAE